MESREPRLRSEEPWQDPGLHGGPCANIESRRWKRPPGSRCDLRPARHDLHTGNRCRVTEYRPKIFGTAPYVRDRSFVSGFFGEDRVLFEGVPAVVTVRT